MSKEGDEMRVAGIIAAGAGLLLVAAVLTFGCGDGPDLVPKPAPAAHSHEPGCGHMPPPDAGADACYCPPGSICPACGMGGFGE